MIDFPIMPEVATKASWLFCGTVYFFTFWYYYQSGMKGYASSKQRNHVFVFFVLLFIICPFYAGDFVHYQTLVKSYFGQENYHLETIYLYLIPVINNNYLLFRLILWGGGLTMLMFSFRKYNVDMYKTLFFLFAIYISGFAYTRAAIGMASYFCGVSLFFIGKEKKRSTDRIVGFGLIILTVLLHRSLIVLVVLTPVAFIPISKKTIPLIFVGTIVYAFTANSLMNNVINMLSSSDEDISHRIDFYSSVGHGVWGAGSSIFGIIPMIWAKVIVHWPYIVCVKYMLAHSSNAPSNIKAIFRISFGLYILVITMLVVYGSTSAFYYRYEGMLYIPITILICYLYQNDIMPFLTYKKMIWLCAFNMFFLFGYRIIFT